MLPFPMHIVPLSSLCYPLTSCLHWRICEIHLDTPIFLVQCLSVLGRLLANPRDCAQDLLWHSGFEFRIHMCTCVCTCYAFMYVRVYVVGAPAECGFSWQRHSQKKLKASRLILLSSKEGLSGLVIARVIGASDSKDSRITLYPAM